MATTRPKATSNRADSSSAAGQPRVRDGKDNLREIIESIAIAFVIAFLFRAFEAEAFVIPTGSMAPTLMGEHKDLFCPQCQFPFQVNASADRQAVTSCMCPNCRFRLTFGPMADDGPIPHTYKGDRIIVAKFPYEVADPARWDVGVFKYPITPKINFIKRIVGLPRESLQIYHGDIYTAPEGAAQFSIERKPPEKVVAMLQPVYDNDYSAPQMVEAGWPERWHDQSGNQWTHPGDDLTRYQTAGKEAAGKAADGKAAEAWLRYSNFVPGLDDWQAIKRGSLSEHERAGIQPRLVADIYAYDYGAQGDLHWVGDLALECELDVQGASGQIVLELIEANRAYQCHFDVEQGTASLSAEGSNGFSPKSSDSAIKGSGKHRVRFANVDDRLLVWVDGRLLEFDASTAYDPGEFRGPGQRDLSPAAVASDGVALAVSHLRVLRDIYYIALRQHDGEPDKSGDLPLESFARELETPGGSDAIASQFQFVEFKLEDGQFMALGDNSPSSKDSRLWPTQHFVGRELLIGKALFIYWPHALTRIPYTRIWFPLFPNIERMKFIH